MIAPGADRAIAAAEAYVECIDRRHETERSEWIASVHRTVSELYAAIVALDWDDTDTDDEHPYHFTIEEWSSLFHDLKRVLGPLDMAWEMFDPYGSADQEPLQGSVADAMADVYGSATNALRIARSGTGPDATNALLIQLEIALGHHALDVMRALDAHRFHSIDAETDGADQD